MATEMHQYLKIALCPLQSRHESYQDHILRFANTINNFYIKKKKDPKEKQF